MPKCDSPAVKRFLPPQGHLGGLFTMIELLVVTAEDIYHISPRNRGAFLSTRRESVMTLGEIALHRDEGQGKEHSRQENHRSLPACS